MRNYRQAVPIKIQGDASIWMVLVTVLGVLASVWLMIKFGTNRNEGKNLPEEAVLLANFTLVPPAGTPWLGLNVATARNGPAGVTVTRVMMGSPAYNAGIRTGDIVESIAGEKVRSAADIMEVLSKHKLGEVVQVGVIRGGQRAKTQVVMLAQPQGRLAAATAPAGDPWLGADIQAIDPLLADRLGLPSNRGVIISYVYAGSPAAGVGLQQGDVIQRIGEVRVQDTGQVRKAIGAMQPGQGLRLSVWRNGATMDIKLDLAARPAPANLPPPTLPEAVVEIEAAWLGLDIVPLTKAEAEELGLPSGVSGMVVDAVAAGPGVDAGFQAGDIIVAVNGRPTTTVAGFKDATEGAVGALVDVIRFGRHLYISVPPPSGGAAAGGMKQPVRRVALRLWN